MCTGGESNQGPLGPKSDALSTAPLRPQHSTLFKNLLCSDSILLIVICLRKHKGMFKTTNTEIKGALNHKNLFKIAILWLNSQVLKNFISLAPN